MTTKTVEYELSLRGILHVLTRRVGWILSGMIVGALLGTIFAAMSQPMYRSEVLLAPLKRAGPGGSMQGLSGQLGGLASLVGVSLGSSDEAAIAVATLRSQLVTRSFIAEQGLLPVLYAREWDSARRTWKTSDPQRIPTVWKAERFFSTKIRKINEDKKSGLITMTIDWTDPKLAAQWAEELVARTNSLLRGRAIESAKKNVAFLQKQIESTNIVEVRQSLSRLLEEQSKELMLAQSDAEYSLKTLDPPAVPEIPINLPKLIVIFAWTFAGLLVSSILVLASSIVLTPIRSESAVSTGSR